MGASDKLSILLADEDALRRDGLAAVLSGTSSFEVIAGVGDGEAAIARIRELRPDVAVIDLNLPRIHGIELIRRIRAEALGTKVVIMASTDDADVVRETVRAGVDGYVLKNSPSRHLVDAISYVRDGGQYFSPQIGRDGRDRHLLEEPARTQAPPAGGTSPGSARVESKADSRADSNDADGEDTYEEPVRPRPRPSRRPANLGQRLREDVVAASMTDRDQEIMSLMAEGIRPILDRLEEIDTRVAMMESGDEELPGDPRNWVTSELTRSLGFSGRGGRGGQDLTVRSVEEFEARLPQMIDEAVTRRFTQMAGKLQAEIEETHVRTMEAFVKNVQVKLVQRVTALEHDMSRQAEAMKQLREYSQRTEENLGRLITGVDRLANDLPRRLAAAKTEADSGARQNDEILGGAPRRVKRQKTGGGARIPKAVYAIGAAVIVLGVLSFGVVKLVSRPSESTDASHAGAAPSADGKTKASPRTPAGMVDTKTKILAAQEAMDRKDYAVAEDVFRAVLTTEPRNAEAIKGLASVLFREDKTDEAAAVLDKLPKD